MAASLEATHLDPSHCTPAHTRGSETLCKHDQDQHACCRDQEPKLAGCGHDCQISYGTHAVPQLHQSPGDPCRYQRWGGPIHQSCDGYQARWKPLNWDYQVRCLGKDHQIDHARNKNHSSTVALSHSYRDARASAKCWLLNQSQSGQCVHELKMDRSLDEAYTVLWSTLQQ